MSKTFILAVALGAGIVAPVVSPASAASARPVVACTANTSPAAQRACHHRWFVHAVSDIFSGRVTHGPRG